MNSCDKSIITIDRNFSTFNRARKLANSNMKIIPLPRNGECRQMIIYICKYPIYIYWCGLATIDGHLCHLYHRWIDPLKASVTPSLGDPLSFYLSLPISWMIEGMPSFITSIILLESGLCHISQHLTGRYMSCGREGKGRALLLKMQPDGIKFKVSVANKPPENLLLTDMISN